MNQLDNTCSVLTDAVIDRIHILCEDGQLDDAHALYEEYKEWISNEGPQEVFVIN